MELEICVHDTTLHPSEEKVMERNEMRSQPAPPHKTPWLVFLWVCHTRRDRKRESEYVSHLCDTQRSGLLAGLCRRVSLRAPARHVRHERAGVLLVCPLYLFILYLDALSPLSFYLLLLYYVSLLVLSAVLSPVYSWLSSHLSIFASFLSTYSFRFLSAHPISLSFCLSIFLSPGLTVWKVDESDCMWQSGMWVILMWLIWCLLTAQWKSFTVAEHWDTATLWPSCPPSPCCQRVCVGRSMYLPVCVLICVCFYWGSKVNRISRLPFPLPTSTCCTF